LNRLFDAPVVATHVGGSRRGGAELTPFGVKLIDAYDRIVSESSRVCRPMLRALGARDR
jgi:molybdate transport repressor ModE-like protein